MYISQYIIFTILLARGVPICVFVRTTFIEAGYAVELSGHDSSANALVFAYTVQDGHETAALEVTSASALNGTVRLNAT